MCGGSSTPRRWSSTAKARYACPEHGAVAPGPARPADLAAGRFEPPCPPAVPLVARARHARTRRSTRATRTRPRRCTASTCCAAWCRETGGQVAALRFHNVYGPGLPRDTPYAGVAALFVSRAGGRAAAAGLRGRRAATRLRARRRRRRCRGAAATHGAARRVSRR